jgi:hypothetical protein
MHASEVISSMCMNILDWCLHISCWVGVQVRGLVSPIGWCLQVLLSWCLVEEICVSSTLVPTSC